MAGSGVGDSRRAVMLDSSRRDETERNVFHERKKKRRKKYSGRGPSYETRNNSSNEILISRYANVLRHDERGKRTKGENIANMKKKLRCPNIFSLSWFNLSQVLSPLSRFLFSLSRLLSRSARLGGIGIVTRRFTTNISRRINRSV